MNSPSPVKVDEYAKEYLDLKASIDGAEESIAQLKESFEEKADRLRDLVRQFGSAHAQKAKMLHGVEYEIMASFGQSVSIDSAAVEKLRAAASDELTPKNFSQLFKTDIRYCLAATAAAFVRTAKLSRKLKALYAACAVVRDNTPRLQVRPKAPE